MRLAVVELVAPSESTTVKLAGQRKEYNQGWAEGKGINLRGLKNRG